MALFNYDILRRIGTRENVLTVNRNNTTTETVQSSDPKDPNAPPPIVVTLPPGVRDNRSVLTYRAEQEGGQSSYLDSECVAIAKAFDFVSCTAHHFTNAQIALMRSTAAQQGTQFHLVPYINGGMTSQSSPPPGATEDWYAHDSTGARVANVGHFSPGSKWLMNHSSAAYRTWFGQQVAALVAARDYDGVWIDVLGLTFGLHPVVPATPVVTDPATGKVVQPGVDYATVKSAFYGQSNLTAQAAKAALPAGKLVIANGIQNGMQFPVTKYLLNGIDGGMPELFIRNPDDKDTVHRTVSQWLLDLQMLQNAQQQGKFLQPMSKTWADEDIVGYTWPAGVEQATLQFCLASAMLVQAGGVYLALSEGPNKGSNTQTYLSFTNYGPPLSPYTVNSGLYVREFQFVTVIVNPDSAVHTATINGVSRTVQPWRSLFVAK